MRISKIINRSRNAEASSVSLRIYKAYVSGNYPTDTFLHTLMNSLNTEAHKLEDVLKSITQSKQLEDADMERDLPIKSIFHLCRAFEYHPDEKVQEAAQVVTEILDNYGLEIIRERYDVQSAQTRALLSDLSSPEIMPHIDALPGISELKIKAANAQSNFEELQNTYAIDVDVVPTENATQIKKKLISIVNDQLIIQLSALSQSNADVYAPLAIAVDNIIDENNAIVKQRSKKTSITKDQ